MIVKIKKYVAKVSVFKEHEDGSISKEVREITLDGKRFSPATVWKKIPREAKLEEFLAVYGKPVAAENAK